MNWLKKLLGIKDKRSEIIPVQKVVTLNLEKNNDDSDELLSDKDIHVETEPLNVVITGDKDEELDDLVFDADKNYHEADIIAGKANYINADNTDNDD